MVMDVILTSYWSCTDKVNGLHVQNSEWFKTVKNQWMSLLPLQE